MNRNHETRQDDVYRLFPTLTVELAKLKNNTQGYVMNVRMQQKQQNSDKEIKLRESISSLKSELNSLTENIRFTLGPFLQNVNDEMLHLGCTAQNCKEEVSKLETQCQNQEKMIQSLEEKVTKLEETLRKQNSSFTTRCHIQKEMIQSLEKKVTKLEETQREQNSFTATLGYTLSSLVWKASKDSRTVKILISNSRLTELFDIVSDSLKSFLTIYVDKMPPSTSNEVRFIISLVGVVTNIAATVEGRKLIIGTTQGQEVIRHFVQNIAKFSDSCVQRLMLMAIFNVSIHRRGTSFVINERSLFVMVRKNLMGTGKSMKYVSLRLLQAIIYNTDDLAHLQVLFDEISISILTEMKEKSLEQERGIINAICQRYSKLEKAQKADKN